MKGDQILSRYFDEYSIIVPKDCGIAMMSAAEGIATILSRQWLVSADIKEDADVDAKDSPYEIVLGDTDRKQSDELIASFKEGEGGYSVVGRRIIVAGYGHSETMKAINAFCMDALLELKTFMKVYMTDEQNFKADLTGYVTAMSYNIYVSIPKDQYRSKNVIDQIKAYSPDLLGVQEATFTWKSVLQRELVDDYWIFGDARDNASSGETALVLIKKDRFKVIDWGTKWLSETPDTMSKVKGSQCYRVVTYAVVEDKDGRIINFASVHLDHTGDDKVRQEQVKYLDMIMDKYAEPDAPTVIVGDFNAQPKHNSYKKMKELGYQSSAEIALDNRSENEPTFEDGEILDYCFVAENNAPEVLTYKVEDRSVFGVASDHMALVTVIKY
jgi:endonuclease/exonuclease/phosphatase family metal-dependent hydrolase